MCVCVCVCFRSTKEIFALFISMAFAFDAFKDVVCGRTKCFHVNAYNLQALRTLEIFVLLLC